MEFNGERFVPLAELMKDEIALEHFHRYHAALNLVKGKNVLDIACGEGYGSALMATVATKVYGVDIDQTSIDHAHAKYSSITANTEFHQGNATSIPLPDRSVDVVVCFETIEHLDIAAQHSFLQEIKRVLVKNGVLLMSTPDTANYSERFQHVNEFHLKEFDKKEFTDFLDNYFENTHLFLQGYEIVSAITDEDIHTIKDAKVIDWDRDQHQFSRKYFIAVCSDAGIDKLSLSSVVFQGEKEYLKIMDRMVEMDSRIEELGKWGQSLDADIKEKDKIIRHYQKEANDLQTKDSYTTQQIEELSKDKNFLQSLTMSQMDLIREQQANILSAGAQLQELKDQLNVVGNALDVSTKREQELLDEWQQRLSKKQDELEALDRQITAYKAELAAGAEKLQSTRSREADLNNSFERTLAEKKNLQRVVSDKDSIIDQQKQKIDATEQQLAITNARLNEIYASEGWKLLKVYYNMKGRAIPENSKRYRFLKNTFNKLRGKKEINELSDPRRVTQTTSEIETPINSEDPAQFPVIELPKFEFPIVSIVIPAYNAWSMNYKCIAAIKENTLGVAYEVILADDASKDLTRRASDFIWNLKVVRNEKNRGFLDNCNHATESADGKYIVFLNNDTEVKAGWLGSMVELMEKDESIGMTGSKLIYPNGQLQEAGGILWKDASAWNFGHKQDPEASEFNYVKEADYISGAAIMIRQKLWKEIGGFDQRYSPAYCEDSDLAFEVRKHGYKVVYQPLSEVVHYEGYSHGQESGGVIESGSIKEYQILNNVKFRQKWKDVLEKEHFPNGENVFWAKDRTAEKKTILIVDHYVPHIDKDAGSKTVFQYLKMFAALNYNIKFIGDNFYRHEPYTTILQQMGIEVLYGPYYANHWQDWIMANKDKFDFVLLNRPHITVKYIDFIKENTNAKILYYGHDLHFIRDLKQYELEKNPELLESSNKWKEIETGIYNKVDIVLTPSEDERRTIETLGVKSKVRAIKPYIFDQLGEPIHTFASRKDLLFVGGFGHTPNVDAVLWFIKDVWPLIKQELPAIKFLVAGSNVPASIAAMASSDIDIKGHVSDKELQDLYNQVRQVIVPLRYGAGVKGKTVEALSNGLPLATTSFGAEGLPGETPFLPAYDNATDFAKEVVRVYKMSDEELSNLSKQEIDYIRKYFHFNVVKEELTGIMAGK